MNHDYTILLLHIIVHTDVYSTTLKHIVFNCNIDIVLQTHQN